MMQDAQNPSSIRNKGLAIGSMVLFCLLSAFLTYERNAVFSTERTLWADIAMRSPGKMRPRFMYGNCLLQEGSYSQALEQFLAANLLPVDVNVDVVNLYILTGRTQYYLRQYGEATKTWQQALRLRSADPEILNDLAMSTLKEGNIAQAVVYAESASKRASDAVLPDILLTLGQIHATAGRFDVANRYIQKALEMADRSPGIYKSTAQMYEELGFYNKAYQYATLYFEKSEAEEKQDAVALMNSISTKLQKEKLRTLSD